MAQIDDPAERPPASLPVVDTMDPSVPALETMIDRFWEVGPEFESVSIRIEPTDQPLALLERLGPSPFVRGGFPLIGFLASTYDRVSRYALERS